MMLMVLGTSRRGCHSCMAWCLGTTNLVSCTLERSLGFPNHRAGVVGWCPTSCLLHTTGDNHMCTGRCAQADVHRQNRKYMQRAGNKAHSHGRLSPCLLDANYLLWLELYSGALHVVYPRLSVSRIWPSNSSRCSAHICILLNERVNHKTK